MQQKEFFERYEIDIKSGRLGGGAFGTVYKAYDHLRDQWKAIKIAEVKFIEGKEFSLVSEFNASQAIPLHKNIAHYESVFQFQMPNGVFDYAVMQYYPEGNLKQLLSQKKLQLEEKFSLVNGLLQGITFLHKNNIIHRDIKPSNILISIDTRNQYVPKIADFGLSKNISDTDFSNITNSFGGGTLDYSSPEQLFGQPLRPNADLWSLGIIVYEIFMARKPFDAGEMTGSPEAKRRKVYQNIIQAVLPDNVDQCPAPYNDIIRLCLIKDPSKRVKKGEDLIEFLKNPVPIFIPNEVYSDDETLVLRSGSIDGDSFDPIHFFKNKAIEVFGLKKRDEILTTEEMIFLKAEEAKLKAETERKQAEEEAKIKILEEKHRKEAETARIRAEEERKHREAEEARQKAAEAEEKARLQEIEEQKLREEAERKKAQEEADRKRSEEEAEKMKLVEEARLRAAAEEKVKLQAIEEQKLKEEAERKKAQEDIVRKRGEEEAEKMKLSEEARLRAAAEEKARLQAIEEQKLREEGERKKAQEEADRQHNAAAVEKRRLAEEEERKKREEQARKKAAAERKLQDEKARLLALEKQKQKEEAEKIKAQQSAEAASRKAKRDELRKQENERRRRKFLVWWQNNKKRILTALLALIIFPLGILVSYQTMGRQGYQVVYENGAAFLMRRSKKISEAFEAIIIGNDTITAIRNDSTFIFDKDQESFLYAPLNSTTSSPTLPIDQVASNLENKAELAFQKLIKLPREKLNIPMLENFLKTYPGSKRVEEIKKILQKMVNDKIETSTEFTLYQEIMETQSPALAQLYIDTYPNGKYINEITNLLKSLKQKEEIAIWQSVSSIPTISGIEAYLSKYPGGKYINEANQIIKDLESQRIKQIGDQQKKDEEAKAAAAQAAQQTVTPETSISGTKSEDMSAKDEDGDIPASVKLINQHLIKIPGGNYTLGCDVKEKGCDPKEGKRTVNIAPFMLGKYEVSQIEYESIMGINPITEKNYRGKTCL
ncbi:MAG: protein kinase [Saprospiraceae bacterium]|nr:protein kinase [Saprospiraceae bacterium]